MLQIVFKDGSSRTWKPCSFTDYEYMKDIFVVVYEEQWVGIYSMSEVKSIEFLEIPDECIGCDEA